MITNTPLAACLNCGHKLNAVESTQDDAMKPEPGSIIVCLHCGGVMKLSDKMMPEGLTDAEIEEIKADEGLMDHLALMTMQVQLIRRMAN